MKKNLIISLLIAAVMLACLYAITAMDIISNVKIIDFYSANIRSSLFSSFLTLSGFLFSLKTFIIVKMKEGVYDNEIYKDRVKDFRKINPSISHYGPLKRLGHLLFFTILSSLVTSVFQLTIGLTKCWPLIYICIGSAIFSITMFVISLFYIKKNLDDWFEFLEENSRKLKNDTE